MSGQLTLHLIHQSFDDDIHIRVEEGRHTYRDLLRVARSYWGIDSGNYLLMGEDGLPREELDQPLTREETLYLVEKDKAVAQGGNLELEIGYSGTRIEVSGAGKDQIPEFSIPLNYLELPDGTELRNGAISYSSGKFLIHSDDFGIASSPGRMRFELRGGKLVLNISGIFIRLSASNFPDELLLRLQEAGLLSSIDINELHDPNLLLGMLIREMGEI